MAPDDFVMTLDSEEESPSDTIGRSKHSSAKEADEALLDPAFTFDMSGDPYVDLLHGGTDFADVVKSGSKPVRSLNSPSFFTIYCFG
jgi:ATP-dependent RNA helicase DDX27